MLLSSFPRPWRIGRPLSPPAVKRETALSFLLGLQNVSPERRELLKRLTPIFGTIEGIAWTLRICGIGVGIGMAAFLNSFLGLLVGVLSFIGPFSLIRFSILGGFKLAGKHREAGRDLITWRLMFFALIPFSIGAAGSVALLANIKLQELLYLWNIANKVCRTSLKKHEALGKPFTGEDLAASRVLLGNAYKIAWVILQYQKGYLAGRKKLFVRFRIPAPERFRIRRAHVGPKAIQNLKQGKRFLFIDTQARYESLKSAIPALVTRVVETSRALSFPELMGRFYVFDLAAFQAAGTPVFARDQEAYTEFVHPLFSPEAIERAAGARPAEK